MHNPVLWVLHEKPDGDEQPSGDASKFLFDLLCFEVLGWFWPWKMEP